MNGGRDRLDFRSWRNVALYLGGIGAETLYALALAGIAVVIVVALRILTG
jgi:hypothetical protein